MPNLVVLEEKVLEDGRAVLVPGRYARTSDFEGNLGQTNGNEWKTVALDTAGKPVVPYGSIGFRWGQEGRKDQGKWNLESKEAHHDKDVTLKLSLMEDQSIHDVVPVGFPYFGGIDTPHFEVNKQSERSLCRYSF
jgi:nitrate reductase alpha subunit